MFKTKSIRPSAARQLPLTFCGCESPVKLQVTRFALQEPAAIMLSWLGKVFILTAFSEELQASTHSQIIATLRPGYDIMNIILRLLNSQHHDSQQLRINKVQQGLAKDGSHVTEYSQDVVLEFLHKVTKATDQQIIHHVIQHALSSQHEGPVESKVAETLSQLRRTGQIVATNGANSISYKQTGQYIVHLLGDISMMQQALVHALHQEAGIERVELHKQL